MKYGLNMLLWTTDVSESHYGLLEQIKSWGYDGVELPIFEFESAKWVQLHSLQIDSSVKARES